ncbi:LacI family DNA-binding transcriptional regulator [Pelagicoccus sp. SDUM812002]|uniref:LacI family DNA-binding transcriptional regulator n=1 Tax=Pelagicoccus sp. SDUM812002 TaxID=3041266 RepID=UPI00280FCEA2|nr:LacI family DNA-binding transcriptional regulator [Pelagicoccus sp. SDUM812002]MDQ8187803.1 LacI family DNA-binding transcriptional regulator [Pelagicoccus sp. SDUM812002]
MSEKRVRLKDIAERAGVTPMAVSYALRGAPNVSEEKRKRIIKIAEEMGYVPDPAVSRMMSYLAGRKGTRVFQNTIALLNTSEDSRFVEREVLLAMFHDSATERAEELGYHLELFWYHQPRTSPQRLAGILKSRGIEGIILSSSGKAGTKLDFDCSGFSFVALGDTIVEPRVNRVMEFHFNNAFTLLAELKALGYRKFGFVFNEDVQRMHAMRHKAAALCHLSEVAQELYVPIYEYKDWDDGGFETWYQENRPEVVVSNRPAAWDALKRLGVAVPEEVGFAQLELFEDGAKVAGMRTRFNLLGRAAVEQLVGQLHSRELGLPSAPKTVKMEGSWLGGPTVRKIR